MLLLLTELLLLMMLMFLFLMMSVFVSSIFLTVTVCCYFADAATSDAAPGNPITNVLTVLNQSEKCEFSFRAPHRIHDDFPLISDFR